MVQVAAQSGPRRTGWRPTFRFTVEPIYWVLVVVFVIGWVAVSLRGGQFLTLTNITNMFVRSISLGLVSIVWWVCCGVAASRSARGGRWCSVGD